MPKTIYISYSLADKELFIRFKKHLSIFEYKNYISIQNEDILADTEYEFNGLVSQADILFVLVSIDFINSKLFKDDNFQLLLTRNEHLHIIPVIIAHCNWESTILANFKVVPEKKIPVTDKYWNSTDYAFSIIMKELEGLFEKQSDVGIENNTLNYIDGDNTADSYIKLIKKANNLFGQEKWAEAIEAYRSAIKYYKDTYLPNINTVREQIHICSEELLYIKNIETAERAFEEKSYKTAVKYFKEALNYKITEEIKEKYLKAEKLARRTKKNKLSKNKKQNTNPPQQIVYQYNKTLLILLFILTMISSVLLTILYYDLYVLNDKDLNIKRNNNIPVENKNYQKKKEKRVRVPKNKIYYDKLILTANNYADKKNFRASLNTLVTADMRTLSKKQNALLQYKIDSIYSLAVNELKNRSNIYISKKQYNAQYHKSIFQEIKYFISLKKIPANKKSILYSISYKLNDIYIMHYISYTNHLVKIHEYQKAKENLLFLRHSLIFATKEQQQIINQKLNNINKIEKLIEQY